MALIKLRNLPASEPGDFTADNLIAVALNHEDLDVETKSFTCGETITGMMSIFSGDASFANFQNGLTVSGESVATGAATKIGGEEILSANDDGDILFGGSNPDDPKDIIFNYGGEERMKVTEVGVDITPGLTVNGQSVITQGGNISLLANDAGYITAADIPEDISEFTNDAGYITAANLPALVSVGVLTLKNGDKTLGNFISSTNNIIDINLPQYDGDEAVFIDSDLNLKDSLNKIKDPIQKVERINGYNFIWNKNADEKKVGEKDVGIIAQEVSDIIPEAVKEKDGSLKVAYHKIIPLLIECIKDQEKRIKHLEEKIK